MAIAFNRGTTLGPDDLNVEIDNGGIPAQPVDPFSITYTLLDESSGIPVLFGVEDQTPIKDGTGRYYVSWQIPANANIGEWKVLWKIQDTPTSQPRTVPLRFQIVNPGVIRYGFLANLDPFNQEMVRSLRIKLGDNSPDKKYHFRPPNRRDFVQGFTEKFDYIWTDEELFDFIVNAVDMVNNSPPQTFWAIPNVYLGDEFRRPLPGAWRTLVILGAMWFALQSQQFVWIADEFDYSISGISLNLEKSSKYASAADSVKSSFDSQLELAKKTVKLTRGLYQRPYGAGAIFRTGFLFRAGTMTVKNF